MGKKHMLPVSMPVALAGMHGTGIKAYLSNDGELYLYGFVGDEWDEMDARTIIQQVQSMGPKDELVVHINSPGGFVFEGLTIFNFLNSYEGTVRVKIDGLAASMASVIAMAGDIIEMPSNTHMMIHNPWDIAIGDAAELRKHADMLDKVKESLVMIYSKRSGKSAEEVSALMDAETWILGTEAVEMGFATVLTDPDESINYTAMDLTGFRNVPPDLQALALRPAAGPRPDLVPPGSNRATVGTHNYEDDAMTDKLKPTPGNEPSAEGNKPTAVDNNAIQAAAEKASADATKAERKRQADIRAAVKAAKLDDDFAQQLVDSDVTLDQARAQIIDKWAQNGGPTQQQASFGLPGGADERDKRLDAMTQATLSRVGVVSVDGANPFRGLRLNELARACAQAAGINTYGMLPDEYIKAALNRGPRSAQTTSDFPVLLENTLHKMVLSGFQSITPAWPRFCKAGHATDFRAWNRLVPGLIGNLDSVNEAGEYLNKNIPDAQKNSVTVTRKGNIIEITIETLVNDDLGTIMDLASGIGMAGPRAIDRAVFALLESNPTLSDGVPLFHANHGNLAASGSAPTIITLNAARVAMAKQTAPGADAEPLDIKPYVAVSGVELQGDIIEIIGAEYNDDSNKNQRKPNKVRNMVEDVVGSPRITSTTAYYVFGNPAQYPVIEVVFLNGQRDPRVVMEENFRTSGIAWKAELPFGVSAIDYRGGYKNAGV